MLFNSIEFLLFLPIVILFFYSIPQRYRWIFLLGVSYFFYMVWKPEYALIILSISFINFFIGKKIYFSKSIRKRKFYLSLSLISCLSILFIFKYEKFLGSVFQSILYSIGFSFRIPSFDFLLPVGISFYTFQTLSYTIDIYRNNSKLENHFGIFSLYVSFFPQLVAGPIERSARLLPQFYKKHLFDYKYAKRGFQLILLGLMKKVVIADRLAIYVDKVYQTPENFDGITFLVATLFFSIQIYCDFSGYTDIAIGSAKILGFDLMENFKRPYFAKSIGDFWRRWHISLSSWFRDYLYIPLGGNKVRLSRWCFNIFIVFSLSGLWHGTEWTFIIWGIIHGTALIVEKVLYKQHFFNNLIILNKKYNSIFSLLYTIIFVQFTWIFFRANTFSDAILIVNKIFTTPGKLYIGTPSTFIYSLFGILFILAYDFKNEWYKKKLRFFNSNNKLVRHLSYATIAVIILMIGVFDEGQFIYFQF